MNGRISRKLGRIRRQCSLIMTGHLLNWPWRSRLERRRIRYEATQKSALRYLCRYLPDIAAIEPTGSLRKEKEPERVFTLWLQGEENAPEIVKACFRSMRRHLKQEVVLQDEKTLFDWISIPDEIVEKWRKGKMRAAHFSDICRVDLLYRHGGYWLDATDFVTAPIPEKIEAQDFFMFMSGSKIRGSYSFVQNCFIRSRKGNPLIEVWRNAMLQYWNSENSVINYFTHQLLFKLAVENNPYARSAFEKMLKKEQDATHTVWDTHKGEPFDAENFLELTKDAFFQKTEYKTAVSKQPPEGSYAAVIQSL